MGTSPETCTSGGLMESNLSGIFLLTGFKKYKIPWISKYWVQADDPITIGCTSICMRGSSPAFTLKSHVHLYIEISSGFQLYLASVGAQVIPVSTVENIFNTGKELKVCHIQI